MKSLKVIVLLHFLLVFGIGEIVAQTRYAKMSDTVFHVGDLIQLDFEFRFPLSGLNNCGSFLCCDSNRYADFSNLIVFIKSHPNLILEIGSHTDWRGSASANLDLSQRRANLIVQCMMGEYGIDSAQVKAVGYGREKPRTIFTCNGNHWVYPDDSLALNCEETPELVTLTNDYINQFKATKVLFERLHQFNRRVEVKIVGIRE